jgi:hypothetical protein
MVSVNSSPQWRYAFEGRLRARFEAHGLLPDAEVHDAPFLLEEHFNEVLRLGVHDNLHVVSRRLDLRRLHVEQFELESATLLEEESPVSYIQPIFLQVLLEGKVLARDQRHALAMLEEEMEAWIAEHLEFWRPTDREGFTLERMVLVDFSVEAATFNSHPRPSRATLHDLKNIQLLQHPEGGKAHRGELKDGSPCVWIDREGLGHFLESAELEGKPMQMWTFASLEERNVYLRERRWQLKREPDTERADSFILFPTLRLCPEASQRIGVLLVRLSRREDVNARQRLYLREVLRFWKTLDQRPKRTFRLELRSAVQKEDFVLEVDASQVRLQHRRWRADGSPESRVILFAPYQPVDEEQVTRLQQKLSSETSPPSRAELPIWGITPSQREQVEEWSRRVERQAPQAELHIEVE